MKNTQRGFIGIAVIILLAAVVGGGVYYKTKINPDFLSLTEDGGRRLPIKVVGTTTTDVQIEKKDHTDTDTSVAIKAPTIPSTSVSLSQNGATVAATVSIQQAPISVPVEVSSDVKVCGDAKCFTDAIGACTLAKYTQASNGELLGSKIDVNFTYETKVGVKNCDLRLTVNSYNIAASAGLLSNGETFQDQNGKTVRFDEFYRDLNIKSQANVGKSMLCPLNDVETKKTYIEIILNKEGYKFILADDSCKGELISTMESVGK